MKIAGFTELTLNNYPGKAASMIHTQGCNFECHYCHNPELIPFTQGKVKMEYLLSKLEKQPYKFVVITGGEPTTQSNLIQFMLQLKEIGFSVKLDTNGSQPHILQEIIENKAADYIAMDIKSDDYSNITYDKGIMTKIFNSVKIVKQIPHEFRITLSQEYMNNVPNFINEFKDKLKGSKVYFQYLDGKKTITEEKELQDGLTDCEIIRR